MIKSPLRPLALALAMAIGFASAAEAHTHVRATSIIDNARLTAAPANFTVAFTDPAGIANVSLVTAAGAAVPLAFQPPHDMAATYTIPLPTLAPGAYVISWRMIARDGHVMNGVVHFAVGEH